MDMADQLQKLQALHEQGVLTDDEFVLAKKRVLDGSASQASNGKAQSSSILNQFRLSTSDKLLGGICGGLATMTDVPAWSWRILFILTAFLHGIGVLIYLLLWMFVPVQSAAVERSSKIVEETK